ncbi:MAG: S24 family peptidase [Deltaproteobacteria bacterium]|nr:MAG: S24 family peptidase [Deltaproteobacteria bacterium]
MAGSPFHFRENECLELFDITHLPGITKETARRCYALRVQGDSMIPFHKDEDILIVEKDSRKNIRHGDTVVCHHLEGSCVRCFDLTNSIPKLRPLKLDRYHEAEPVFELTKIDKVVFVIFS